jgi:two-component system chemotaxis response regulator CheB
MGKDGSEGMSTIKINGGYNIAQDEESSVIYGMPGNAVQRGVVDSILSLEEISKVLNNLTKVK